MGYYIRALSCKKSDPKWKVQYISRKKEDTKTSAAKFPSRTWDIPQDRWRGLGFFKHMTIGEARDIAKALNAKAHLKRQEEQLRKFQLQLTQEQLANAAFLPDEFVAEFEGRFIRSRDSETESGRRRTSRAHIIWRTAQRMIRTIGIPPSEWFEHSYEIYDWFYHQQYSISYLVKIIRLANLWGYFFCKKTGKPFLAIPLPRGYERKRLVDAYHSSGKSKRKASAPITPIQLQQARMRMSAENFNWVFLSVWLGLRPKEVDSLKDSEHCRVQTLDRGQKVLWVYQTKIFSLPPDDRWKLIPILFDEQEFALRIIAAGSFERPLVKTMKKYFGAKTNLYGGRKGFTDLMLERGHSLEAISQWMGHATIDRTWKSYKDRKGISFTL